MSTNALSPVPAAETQPLPVLYSFRRCPYAMRARLAIAVSGQHCELREVVLRDKPAELIAASPKATVPVLVIGGQVIEQSLEIMHWALARRDPDGWLSHDAQRVSQLIDTCDGPFKRALDAYKYPERHADWPEGAARDAVMGFFEELEARLSAQAFLLGSTASLADAALMPFVRQAAKVDEAWFDALPLPHLQGWLSRWVEGPLFARVMYKYVPWRQDQPAVRFPPSA